MKYFLATLFLFSTLFISSLQTASAEVMSNSCPFSCKTLKLDKKYCRDWKKGNTCYVDKIDVDSNEIISRPCPFSCARAKID